MNPNWIRASSSAVSPCIDVLSVGLPPADGVSRDTRDKRRDYSPPAKVTVLAEPLKLSLRKPEEALARRLAAIQMALLRRITVMARRARPSPGPGSAGAVTAAEIELFC
ncbi:hypothetical protein CS8_057760 [Cupriavidus sp. 8B]